MDENEGDRKDLKNLQILKTEIGEVEEQYSPQLGPFVNLLSGPIDGFEKGAGFKITNCRLEDLNKYWTPISSTQTFRYRSSIIPDWCLKGNFIPTTILKLY